MSVLTELSRELESLVARTSPAVASVERRRGQGSGVVLTPDGYVLTNWHVVRGARRLRIGIDGECVEGRIVGSDARTDLAVVRTDARDLTALQLREDLEPRVGQIVVAIGNPLSLERSVSLGLVSALERALPAGRNTMLEGLIQTDAAINPGNSGGPLLDAEGRAIGVNVAAARFASGIGFAIPARTAAWVASELIRVGAIDRPYLGVAARGEPLGRSVSLDLGQARAVRVLQVDPGGPASKAGVRDGDLLLGANGHRLGWVDDLQRVMVLGAPRDLRLDVWRHRRTMLVAKPERRQAA